ncbi:MAG: DPP IV N-terminal domain-containing protein [bacterium]|nr:DPP IV N-terminal domain-containing protein [bacterium]
MQNLIQVSFSSRCWGSVVLASALTLAGCSGGGGSGAPAGPGPGPGPGPGRTAETAIYLAETGVQLMGVPDDGSATPVALSAPAMTRVLRWRVSPDGGAVAYIADCDQVDRFELYVREIGGAAAMRVSLLMNAFNDVMDFVWAPDSQSLAYRADGVVDDRAELFRVSRDGATHYRVYQSGIASIHVADDYGWSDDSRYVYCLMQQTTTRFDLRLHDAWTNAEGAQAVLTVAPGRDIVDVTFSPDSAWIALRSDYRRTQGQFEVLRLPTDFGGPLRVSNGSVGTTQTISSYSWSSDSMWLAQKVRTRSTNTRVGINVYSIANNTSRRVASTNRYYKMAWAPMSNRLAFVASYDPFTRSQGGPLQLIVYDADANTMTAEQAPYASGEELLEELFEWSPDGTRLAYVTRVTFNDERTYQVLVGASQPAIEAIDLQRLGVLRLIWSFDGSRLAVLEHDNTQAFHPAEWHILDLDGRSGFRSGVFNSYFTAQELRWSRDNARAVYAVDAAQAGPSRIRAVSPDGDADVSLSNDAILWFDYASGTLQ